jgi:alanine-glyoxylate transaminase/serine-glyoxylate transaminase/serine-pyruvate transaminase
MTKQGVHHLHIPGPSPVPERVLAAISRQVIDHRGPEFARLGQEILEGLRALFNASGPILVYPSSGTGAWEAAIVNVLSPGDKVLMIETGHFSTLWRNMADRWGVDVEYLAGDWRQGADPLAIEGKLAADKTIKAVMVVHNETSTGVTSRIADIRKAMDFARHPALLMVDAISSLGSVEFQQEAWGVDVAVSCSQKGLMLPPGLGLVSVSHKALATARQNKTRRSYWDWSDMLIPNSKGFFPYTPATNLLFGLRESLAMLREEGLTAVFARHQHLGAAARAAVRGWGLEVVCKNPLEYSPVLTAVLLPDGHDAELFRRIGLDKFNISLGAGLSKMAGKVFRIGHLGACDELTLMGALCGVEMTLTAANVPHRAGGVLEAMAVLGESVPLRLTA